MAVWPGGCTARFGFTKTEHMHDLVIGLFVNKAGASAGQMRATEPADQLA